MKATYAKLKKTNEWGIRVVEFSEPPKPGDTVTVFKKDGTSQEETIAEIVKQFDDAIYCAIVKRRSNSGGGGTWCSCCGEEPARPGSQFCSDCEG